MADRMLQVNELVRQQLGEIINEEVELPPGAILTITRVDVSKDLRHAKVYVSILPDDKSREAFGVLVKERKNLQSILGSRVSLRNTPRIRFATDDSEQEASEMDQLLDNLRG